MKFNSSAGPAEVAVLLLIPARRRGHVYVPVSLGASLIEFDSESRHTNVLEDRLINTNFVPDLEESTIRLQFQVLLNNGLKEHSVNIIADSHPIWFSGWALLHGQTQFALDVSLTWFRQDFHIYFPHILHSSRSRVLPAYSAVVEVYETSVSQEWKIQAIANANGTAIIYTIMNSTYTYSSHYRTTVNNLSRSSEASDKVLLIQRQTFRTRGPASIDLPVQFPLLCEPSTSFFKLESLDATARFPATSEIYAIYRPWDTCQWQFSMPNARALQAVVYMQSMSAASTLTFSTRAESLDDPDERLTLYNSGSHMISSMGMSLKVSSNVFVMLLEGEGSAGCSPVIEWAALSTRTAFSWGFTIMVAACTVICTCIAWVAWMLKAYLDHQRWVARERQLQLGLVDQGTPVSVRVPSTTLRELPLVKYGEDLGSDPADECCICLELFEGGEIVNKLACGHFFHKDCIYSWLRGHNYCPLCKEIVSGTTASVCMMSEEVGQSHIVGQTSHTVGQTSHSVGQSHTASDHPEAQHPHRRGECRREGASIVGEQWSPTPLGNAPDLEAALSVTDTTTIGRLE